MTWTSKELAASTCHGSLTIGSTSMNNKAWASLNNFVLWPSPDRRGENLLIPGASGRITLPKRIDETGVTLECVVIGDCTSAGVAHASRSAGLSTNWMTIAGSLATVTDSTTTASLVMPHGSTITGTVQVVKVEPGETGVEGVLTFTVDLILPQGRLA